MRYVGYIKSEEIDRSAFSNVHARFDGTNSSFYDVNGKDITDAALLRFLYDEARRMGMGKRLRILLYEETLEKEEPIN